MRPLSDISSVIQTLRKGVEAGHWTVEDLDRPSPGFVSMTRVDRRIFQGGYEGVQFRNLLRDGPPVVEKVQVIADKDLPPMPHGVTPAQHEDLPITLEEEFPL